jgi:cobalt-zinc-cadmium efflux system outer membrane protein
VVHAVPDGWTLDSAIVWALQNNPELAAIRQQHGIAESAIVIARTHPYNPTLDSRIAYAHGPEGSGTTNPVDKQYAILFQLELRGQRGHRLNVAFAALSRTDWEIAYQENSLGVRVVRAFQSVVYRREKLALIEEFVRLNKKTADQVPRLVELGKLRGADLLLIRTEVDDARAQLVAGRSALATAEGELRRALGIVGGNLPLLGSLKAAPLELDADTLTREALERRADLHAHAAGIDEAEARLRLTVADRFGNPSIGPAYQYDQSRVNFFGAQLSVPLPILNTHRGEIMQHQAERERAVLEFRQIEIQVRQDVQTALAQLRYAREGVKSYETELLPHLREALEGMEKLFLQNDPGVDLLRLLDLRRKLLKARDGYLDALAQLNEAQANLAAAVGDLALAVKPVLPRVPPMPPAP